jgi:uncharacterized protein (TIGR03086 family)
MLDLAPAAYQVIHLLEGVKQEQLTHPTPCTDMPVAGLLDHFMGLTLAFAWGARKAGPRDASGTSPRADAASLDPSWRTLLPERLDQLVEAWGDPAAWEGVTEVAGVPMPADTMGVVALDELVMHGWDLARATGQPFVCDPVSTAAVLEFTATSARPENAATRQGVFGPVVEVPADAPPLHRALGYAGRDPAWTPSSLSSPSAPVSRPAEGAR